MAGLSRTSGCSRASDTIRGAACETTCWQNECESGVSRRLAHGSGSPCWLLKNWRWSSTSDTIATGTPSTAEASLVMRSKRSSTGVSSSADRCSALNRAGSSRAGSLAASPTGSIMRVAIPQPPGANERGNLTGCKDGSHEHETSHGVAGDPGDGQAAGSHAVATAIPQASRGGWLDNFEPPVCEEVSQEQLPAVGISDRSNEGAATCPRLPANPSCRNRTG